MTGALETGAATYVAVAVTLAVWIGIFVYLWRIDAQARALKRELERTDRREQPAPPRATVTRVSEGEPVEK